MGDLISVIVPVYNVEAYLEKCLESICKQTYRNLDIILVDDGSSDKSSDICDLYKKRDKRINVIHKRNGGLSDARNCGIASANGDYLMFIDSDDYIEQNMIEILYYNLTEMDADISVCGYFMVYENRVIKICDGKNRTVYLSPQALKVLLKKENIGVVAWNKLYKRTLFNDVRYPIGQQFEDINTTYKLIAASNKIVYDPQPMYYYIQRTSSINGKNFKAKRFNNTLYDMEKATDELLGYVENNHLEALKNISIGCLDFYLRIINQEILFNILNKDLITKAKKIVNRNTYFMLNTSDIGWKKKLQFVIFKMNFNLYKIFIKMARDN